MTNSLVQYYKGKIESMYKPQIISDIRSGRDIDAIIFGYGATFPDQYKAFKQALESFEWYQQLFRPVKPLSITPAHFSPKYKSTQKNVGEDMADLARTRVPENVFSLEDAIRSNTIYGNLVKNILVKGYPKAQLNKFIKERAFRQLLRKYKPSLGEEEIDQFRKVCSPSVWFSFMNEPPRNALARKDADRMQKLCYELGY